MFSPLLVNGASHVDLLMSYVRFDAGILFLSFAKTQKYSRCRIEMKIDFAHENVGSTCSGKRLISNMQSLPRQGVSFQFGANK
jgi:hypothetical protein